MGFFTIFLAVFRVCSAALHRSRDYWSSAIDRHGRWMYAIPFCHKKIGDSEYVSTEP